MIACNTASSYALKSVQSKVSVPVFDVINPCVQKVANANSEAIAILGTEKTIESKIYCQSINLLNSKIKIYNQACPLFVPIVEEGLENHNIAHMTTKLYLESINSLDIDTIILGCTHYPMLINTIKRVIDSNIFIIDTGVAVSKDLMNIIDTKTQHSNITFKHEYYVSDMPYRFHELASKFLDQKVNNVRCVEFR